jgi:hypothetical protein
MSYINYIDVMESAKVDDFYKQSNFKEVFSLIFKFKENTASELMLKNWSGLIKDEILNCKRSSIEEQYQIKRISLKELTVIANLGKYSVDTLKMNPYIAMAFTLGIYYGTFIFEQTALNLTIEDIYSIIPINKRIIGKNKFIKQFVLDGTSNEVLKILFKIKNTENIVKKK